MENRFLNWQQPALQDGELTPWHWKVDYVDMLTMGEKTDIGSFCYFNAKNGIIIEDFVQIGSHCSIYTISTIDNREGPVVLKKNCKIGAHAMVMPGITIGENAVVGACSFVNKNIPANTIYYGIPVSLRGIVKPPCSI